MIAYPDLGVYLQPDPLHRASTQARSGPQAYAYASGRPLVFADPDGRFVVDWRSLRERCCDDCDDTEARLRQLFDAALVNARTRGNNPICSQHFDPDGLDWILGDGTGPSLDFDTMARYKTNYSITRPSFSAFTMLGKVHVTCETMEGSTVPQLAQTLMHEAVHTTQPFELFYQPGDPEEVAVNNMLPACGF